MLDFISDWLPWVLGAGIVLKLAQYLLTELLLHPRPRQRTLAVSRRLPFPRERVWQAYLANMRITTPGRSFATLAADDVIEFEAGVGPNNEERCLMQVRIVACDPARYLEMQPMAFNGGPFPGGDQARDGIKLADDGDATIATIFLHVETPDLLHAWFMRKAIGTAFDKVTRRLVEIGGVTQQGAASAA